MSRLASHVSAGPEAARIAAMPVVAVRPVMLAIDAEPSSQEQWKSFFGSKFDVRAVRLDEGLAMSETSPFDVVLVDLRSANDPASVLSRLRQRQPQAAIVAVASSAAAAVSSLSQGATEYILRPVANAEDAGVRVDAALARRRAGADAELLATPYSAARAALIKNFDVRYLQGLMRATRGNISEASRRSGIDRANLRRMLKHHGISPLDFGAVRPARPVTAAS